MDVTRFQQVSDLFETLVGTPREQRGPRLESACADDPELREEVLGLLAQHEDDDHPLGPPDAAVVPMPLDPSLAAGGESPAVEAIDGFRFVRRLGEGGMGVVHEAEQDDPRRRVAIKLIRSGHDSATVLARFQVERQVLARLNHPGIAAVHGAGTTPSGRPYVVMELVDGVTLPAHCDMACAGTTARLRLMVDVCRAVQHAHQRGIIHRDLKPSNVLVTDRDGVSAVKIIDFGIARATDATGMESTLLTMPGQAIGTPAYMAPEQAEGGEAGSADVRVDVYALGVMLYELLTGTPPFDVRDLASRGFSEMLRVLREVDPERPSTRLSGLGDVAEEIAGRQQSDVRRLQHRLRGDLDWIVMRCLEKDPADRYASVAALADDIERHLGHEPVRARPPRTGDRVRKFVRRNRGLVTAGALVAGVLIVGIVGTSLGLADAVRARKAADATSERLQQVVEFQAGQLTSIDPQTLGQRLRGAVLDLSPGDARGELETALAGVNFTTVAQRGLEAEIFEPSLAAIDERFADEPLIRADLLQATADAMNGLGLSVAAIAPGRKALAIRLEQRGEHHTETIHSRTNLGVALAGLGQHAEAAELLAAALASQRRSAGEDDPDTLTLVRNVGVLYKISGDLETAEPYYRDVLAARIRLFGPADPKTLDSRRDLATLLRAMDRPDEAIDELVSVLATLRGMDVVDDLAVAELLHAMGSNLRAEGRVAEAIEVNVEAFDIRRRQLGDDHPDTISTSGNVAAALISAGRYDEALAIAGEAEQAVARVVGTGHWHRGVHLMWHGLASKGLERWAEAEASLLEAHRLVEAGLGPNHGRTLGHRRALADLYDAWDAAEPGAGHAGQAATWRPAPG
ncbi:MAG: tetratricopeptide repeat protein [Phycisphaerales bacterium]